MDYLEYGYTAAMRWRADSDETVTIRWYRAADDAKTYLEPHAFGSTVWDDPSEIANTGPGEVAGSIMGWSPSVPPPPAGLSTPTPADYLLFGAPPECADEDCTHISVQACGCGFSDVST